MTPHRRTTRLICGGGLNIFALVMVLVVFLMFSVVLISPGNLPQGTWGTAQQVHHPKILGAWTWGANRSDAIVVSITRDDRIYFRADAVAPAELPTKIREYLNSGSERRVYLRADARIRYDAVKLVLNAMQSVGLEDVSIFASESRDMGAANHGQ